MEIRTAAHGDEAQIVALINNLIVELGGPSLAIDNATSTTRAFIAGEMDGEIVVASEGTDLVAVCTLTYQPSIRTLGPYGIIQEMYVAPEHRNAELGAQIIEMAVVAANKAGCAIVELSTPPAGERAESFYRRVGFSQVGVRMRYKI